MNIKSIATLGIATIALAFAAVAPAEANNNNNKYLNQLAMQMYMQNQMNAGAYGAYGAYNPLAAASYVNPYSSGVYGGSAPWAAGAMPYGTQAVNYGYGGYSGYGGGCGYNRYYGSGLGNTISNVVYNNPVSRISNAAYGRIISNNNGYGRGFGNGGSYNAYNGGHHFFR